MHFAKTLPEAAQEALWFWILIYSPLIKRIWNKMLKYETKHMVTKSPQISCSVLGSNSIWWFVSNKKHCMGVVVHVEKASIQVRNGAKSDRQAAGTSSWAFIVFVSMKSWIEGWNSDIRYYWMKEKKNKTWAMSILDYYTILNRL